VGPGAGVCLICFLNKQDEVVRFGFRKTTLAECRGRTWEC